MNSDAEVMKKVKELRERVEEFAGKYPMPGFDQH